MGSISALQLHTAKGTPFLLRTAERRDAKALVDYGLQTLLEGEGQIKLPEEFHITPDQEETWIEQHRLHPDRLAIVAEAGGPILGMLNFQTGALRRKAHVGTFGMSVAAAWRGQGVGRALLSALLDWARRNPRVEKIALAVLADNERAIGLYRSLGFVQEGRRIREIRFEDGRWLDDILMYRLARP